MQIIYSPSADETFFLTFSDFYALCMIQCIQSAQKMSICLFPFGIRKEKLRKTSFRRDTCCVVPQIKLFKKIKKKMTSSNIFFLPRILINI